MTAGPAQATQSTAAQASHLTVAAASKRFGATTVLDHVDLEIARGELVTLLGPSGCGKTTLLRLVAGLAVPDAGTITIAGRDVTRAPPHKRNVGVVFQSYALFPHLSVAANVAFGLSVRHRPKTEIASAVSRALALVHLEHVGDRSIGALSGGQQQRIALARALAVEPDVLLFDEALSALDRNLREEMQVELRRILNDIGATAIFVTHDQDEALTMSDRIAVMNRGRIEQCAAPRDVYARPASLFALQFIGLSTRMAGHVVGAGSNGLVIETPMGRVAAVGQAAIGSAVIAAVRPEHMRIGGDGGDNSIVGRVRSTVYRGSRSLIELDGGATASITAELPGEAAGTVHVGDEIRLSWPASETFAFADPAETAGAQA